uniref:RRM domain-containing protein n=1 Tax=Cuerna arida TaxID=1464854 RepID=A0A1B6H2U1_9HEMI
MVVGVKDHQRIQQIRLNIVAAQPVWDNERLPPPPGCESFISPANQQDNWMGPMPHHMGKPPFPPQHPPGPPAQYQNLQMYTPPQQPQGCEDQYNPVMNTNTPHPNNPNRIVQFSESGQLVTVENQHFQRPSYDQNCGPVNNQFPPHQNVPAHYSNNNTFPNQFNHSQPRPNFPPQPFPIPNSPQNYHGYPPQEYHPPHSNPPQFQNFENNLSPPPQTMNGQQNQWTGPHSHPPPQPPWFCDPQPQFQPRPPFQQQNFRPPVQNQIKRGMGMKRVVPRQPLNNSVSPAKQMRFEHTKLRTAPSNIRSNLQEIKTVDNLPDTTTTQEPEPEIEEDEETKQYRLKIAEQKALREKILKEKEARRLAAIIEKQNKQENNLNNTSGSGIKPVCVQKTQPQHQPPQRQQPPPQRQQPLPQHQQPPPQRHQAPPQRQHPPPQRQHPPPLRQPQPGPGRGRGRGRNPPSLNRQPMKPLAPGAPVVQIQQMLGTMYKIVKVRTKEGAIVTRKTPLVMNSTGTVASPMKTVSSTAPAPAQRRVVLPQASTKNVGNVGRGGGGGNTFRMISASQTPQGRTLFTVQTTPMSTLNKVQGPPRVVIDKRPINTTMKIVATATPSVPVSTLVTVDNLSLSTSQAQIQKLAKQVGSLSSIKHEPELKRATLRFKNPKEAERFFLKFHRKMIDLSRISVTVVPE